MHLARARNAGERAPEEDRGDEYYDYSYDPRDARARGYRDGGYYDGGYYDGGPRAPSSSASRDDYERQAPPGGPPPDVTLLTQREIQSLLPIGATGEQYAYFWGGPETAVQRLGLSLVGLVATVNLTALLAVPTATFFLWAPVALAARRNSKVRSAKYAGLWRAKVVSVEPVETRATASADWMFNLLIGDSSGARVPLKIPLKAEYADINVGDDVELVVTSDDPYFYTFQAVREAYFPFLNIWAGEYPFLDRRGMVAVSDRIASIRNKADARAAGARRDG